MDRVSEISVEVRFSDILISHYILVLFCSWNSVLLCIVLSNKLDTDDHSTDLLCASLGGG